MTTPDLQIKARDLMETRIVAVTRQYKSPRLPTLSQSCRFRGVPASNPGNNLLGFVTEFDILKAILAKKDLMTLKAEDIMSGSPVTVEETDTAEHIVKQMIDHQVIRIPVVREGRLIGVISRTDLLNHLVASNMINVYGA